MTKDERLTEARFAEQLNTVFRVKVGDAGSVDLKLVEVKGYQGGANEQSGMERFSLYFQGPSDVQLPQATHKLEHEQLGSLDIFLVTIARDEQSFTYEAVFNLLK